MVVDVVVPALGESVNVVYVAKWLKNVGDSVAVDEPLVSLDSDKATVDVPSPASGRVLSIAAAVGDELPIGAALLSIEEGVAAAPTGASSRPPASAAPADDELPAAKLGPAASTALAGAGVATSAESGSGTGGRVTRDDVDRAIKAKDAAPVVPAVVGPPAAPTVALADEEVVPMSRVRRRIAERLVEAQQTAAILTTFNEVDMTAVTALRERYQPAFTKKYGVKLGFMSFFVKASIDALKAYPAANAEIRGTDIVYKRYYHVGVAVSGPRGLVVPVLRDADRLSFAETEQSIAALGERARDNALVADDLSGGSFTVSNGGIFGSLMSTPILNPPQVAILGMHSIQKRAVVVNDTIVIRPMMYLAVSYDHRLLDGREAVGFLVRIKECVENPERMLLEV